MKLTLTGPLSVCISAGILLLSKAKTFGQPLQVLTTHNKPKFPEWQVPTLVHDPVLAALGLPTLGHSEVVSLGGESTTPLNVHLNGELVKVDRSGIGVNVITNALLEFFRNGKSLKTRTVNMLCSHLAIPKEPAVFDLLLNPKIPIGFRFAILKSLRDVFGIKHKSQRIVKQFIVFDDSDIDQQWAEQSEALALLVQPMGKQSIEDLLAALDKNVEHLLKIQILEWAQYLTLPIIRKTHYNTLPIAQSLPGALGNTCRQHPVHWIAKCYDEIGGHWSAAKEDAIHIDGLSDSLPSDINELLTVSNAAHRHAEKMWASIMGRE